MANPKFLIEIPELPVVNAKLTAAPATLHRTLEGAVKAATLIMQTLAKANAPVRTGKLRAKIDYEASGLQGAVFPDLKVVPYAVYVHEGTGIYGKKRRPIMPKSKQVLATRMNPGWGSANKHGYYIIGKYSRGQRPNPFMKYAFDQGRTKVLAIMGAAYESAMKEIL